MLQLALPLQPESLSKEKRKENEGLKYVLLNIHNRSTVIIGGKKVLDVLLLDGKVEQQDDVMQARWKHAVVESVCAKG